MRTTVDLDEILLRRAKERAAASSQSLSDVVQDALRAYLTQRGRRMDPPFELITAGTPDAPFPTPSEVAEELEAEDVAALRIRGAFPRADA
jgi:Bacterial antitoxin of type II TA system, VapB